MGPAWGMEGPWVEFSWASMWTDVERALRADLRRRPGSMAVVDDVIQDVAMKLLVCNREFESKSHLLNWARRVAANRCTDLMRCGSRLAVTDEVPDCAARDDIAHSVEQRSVVEAVLSAVARLSESDRRALVARPPVGADRFTQNRYNVSRHRARAHLRTILQRLSP